MQKQVYRFKVIKVTSDIMVGVAPDTPLFTEHVWEKYVAYDAAGGRYEGGKHTSVTNTPAGGEFSMTVDLSNKTLSFTREGKNLIDPLSIGRFGDMQKLRPIVQICNKDDSLEIL